MGMKVAKISLFESRVEEFDQFIGMSNYGHRNDTMRQDAISRMYQTETLFLKTTHFVHPGPETFVTGIEDERRRK
jgi:hypothetical protein